MRILLTGGTGFIGEALSLRLLRDGHELRLFSRSGPRPGTALGDGVEHVRGTVNDIASVRAAARGCDAVVHLAAREDVPLMPADDPYGDEMFSVNVLGTRSVLEAARAEAVERCLVVTSCTTFGHAGDGVPNDGTQPCNVSRMNSVYVWSRVQQEQVCLQAAAQGQHVVIVAPTVIIGPGDDKGSARAIDAFRRGRLPVVPPGGYNFIAIEDVAEGLAAALERGESGRRYLFAHENLTYRELFTRVGQVTGRPPPRQAPQQLVRPLLTASDAIASLLRLRVGLRGAEAILVQRYFFDAHVAVSELGLPQTPIDDAIERTVASLSSVA